MRRFFNALRAKAAITLGMLFILAGCNGAPGTSTGTAVVPTAPVAVIPSATVIPTPSTTVMPTPTATALPIEVGDPVVGGSQSVGPGDQIPISIPVEGPAGVKIDYIWIAPEGKGKIVAGDGTPAITYEAPTEPGTYQIRVKVTAADRDIERSVSIKVEVPPTPTPPPLTVTLSMLGEIKFSSPESLQERHAVPCENLAEGTYSSNITQEIWPVIYVGGRFHPQDQGGGPAQKADGRWFGTVRFDDCTRQPPTGIVYQLIILTADAECNQAFEEHLATARSRGFPGMDRLPGGCQQHVSIFVTRQ